MLNLFWAGGGTVDTLASGASERKLVRVQIPLCPPTKDLNGIKPLFFCVKIQLNFISNNPVAVCK